ncbi:MAG: TolC family protein [Betaproteobacteria bacterium]|nr:TolC family protein [Betaproteobacteria bacterium]
MPMKLLIAGALRAVPLVLCWAVSLAHAADTLTLEHALELAERNSPRLGAAIAEVSRARSGIRTARTYPNPELEASTGRIRARVPGAATGQGVVLSLGQPIDLPSQRTPRIQAAEAGLAASRFALDEARLMLRADVKQAFYTVLRRKAEYELLHDNQKLLDQIKNRIELSVNVGERAKFELVRVEAELANAMNQAASAELRVAQALAELRLLIGVNIPPGTEVVGEPDPKRLTATIDKLVEEMNEHYPAMQRVRAEVSRAENRLEAERANRIPRPTIFAGVDRDPEQTRTLVGVTVPLPLWDRRQGPIGEAVATFQQAGLAAEQTRLDLRHELEINYSRLLVARQQIEAFEGGLIRQAENALRVAEAAFRFGERGFLEVLDAQRVLRQVRTDFLSARFDKQAALIEIERLTGRDLAAQP